MSEDSDQERTEAATGKRRQDFRERGQVAQSREVGTAALMTSSLLLWVFYAEHFWQQLSQLVHDSLAGLAQPQLSLLSTLRLGEQSILHMVQLLWPIFLLTLVVGFLASFLQVGPLFSTQVFTPDIKKFNPIKGMGKFISKRSALEALKSLSKVALVGAVTMSTLMAAFGDALKLISTDLSQTMVFLGNTAFSIMLKACGIFILLAAIDFLYSRWEMEEKMKMTKQEVKEEFKETEGDPQLKSRVRSVQREMAQRRMMADVPKADVIITNPTHLSIAIIYERGAMEAPKVLAKGADHLAFRIREIARENKVPIVENKPVARALYKMKIGAEIPEELFKAVAEILAYVYSLKK